MDELIQQYGQFIVMALVFVVGAAVYGGYLYYKNQESLKKVNTNLQQVPQGQPQQKPPQQKQPPRQQPPEFVPSKEFKGEQKGYTFKNGDKGQGYYMDK